MTLFLFWTVLLYISSNKCPLVYRPPTQSTLQRNIYHQLPLLFASLIRPRDAQCEWIITFVYSRTNLPCYVIFAALRMPSWVKCLLWSKMFVRWRQVWCKHGDFRLSCAHPLDSALNQRVNGRVLRHRRDSIGKYTATAHGSMTSTLTVWGSTLESAFDLGVCTDSHRNRSCVV